MVKCLEILYIGILGESMKNKVVRINKTRHKKIERYDRKESNMKKLLKEVILIWTQKERL